MQRHVVEMATDKHGNGSLASVVRGSRRIVAAGPPLRCASLALRKQIRREVELNLHAPPMRPMTSKSFFSAPARTVD